MTWIAQTSCIHVDAGLHGEEHVVSYLPLSHIAAQVSNNNNNNNLFTYIAQISTRKFSDAHYNNIQ